MLTQYLIIPHVFVLSDKEWNWIVATKQMFCHGIEFRKFYVVYRDKLNLLDLTISNHCHEQTRQEQKFFLLKNI